MVTARTLPAWSWLIALALVPAAKVSLLFWEYRLEFDLNRTVELLLLAVSLAASMAWSVVGTKSGIAVTAKALGLLVWAGVAYLVVSFVPGCMWAPCL